MFAVCESDWCLIYFLGNGSSSPTVEFFHLPNVSELFFFPYFLQMSLIVVKSLVLSVLRKER